MLFEDFDKKIKEAADQHHPAYDEKAWHKMEKLLNQHLPQQKDDRRRVLFFLLALLLIGGGTWMFVSKPWNKASVSARIATKNKSDLNSPVEHNSNQNPKTSAGPNIAGNANSAGKKSDVTFPTGSANSFPANSAPFVPLQKSVGTGVVQKNPDLTKSQETSTVSAIVSPDRQAADDKKDYDQKSTAEISKKSSIPGSPAENHSEENKTNVNTLVKNETNPNKDQKTSTPAPNQNPAHAKSAHDNNNNGLSFFVSTGPDVSKAGESKAGKTTLLYGAGIGYTKNRFTLRTGLYASRKIYWANADDYKLSFVPTPPTKFIGANANCDVLDIPVKLSYAFSQGGKNNWFAGIGLSSYWMKKEQYVYTYKSTSTTYYFPYETKNENKNYLSVLDISAGYTHKISRVVSISAEPYVELPLTGIGVGKVRLNSAGVLFTIGIKPFGKK